MSSQADDARQRATAHLIKSLPQNKPNNHKAEDSFSLEASRTLTSHDIAMGRYRRRGAT